MGDKVRRTERGWAGHFICAHDCLFRRNTLLEYKNIKIVISTVGLQENRHPEILSKDRFVEIGYNRYYETMAFRSNPEDERYHDIDATREIGFDSPWSISRLDADDKANDMHDTVVSEIKGKLLKGEIKG